MNILTCPVPTFRTLLQALREDPRGPLAVRVGLREAPSEREWLAREVVHLPAEGAASPREALFRVGLSSAPPAPDRLVADLAPPGVVGCLYLGDGPCRGHLWGSVRVGNRVEPLHRLFLPGPGMHRVHPATPEEPVTAWARERWSRTMGALGGEEVWQRLVGLHIAVIGCGRTGSLVAVTLARLGVRRLTLIDPDRVEPHNLGEMDAVSDGDVGRAKAEAMAAHLRRVLPGTFAPVVAAITDPAALEAAKGCEVLFCCVDNDAARLAVALLATLYHKVLVDVGTGVHFAAREGGEGRRRVMGADVRLILPGDGCLLCRGHLSDYAQAVDDLCHHRRPETLYSGQRDWRRQRAGSLRTLNQLAAALGVQMLQDLVAERLRSSTWAHLEYDETGRLQVEYPAAEDAQGCLLCAKAGWGDAGLRWSSAPAF